MLKDFITNKKGFAIVVIMQCAITLMNIGCAVIYGELINSVSKGVEASVLLRNILLTVGYTLLMSLIIWFSNYYVSRFFDSTIASLRKTFVGKIFGSKYEEIASDDSAKYLNNITNDIPNVAWAYMGSTVWFIANAVTVIGSFIAALIISYKIALTMLGFTVIMALLPLFIKKPLDRSSMEMSEKNKGFIGVLKEHLLGISIIKGFGAEKLCEETIELKNKILLQSQKKHAYINSFASGLGNLVREMATVSLIGLTCYFVFINEVEIGAVLTIFSVGSRFYGGMLGASANVTRMEGTKTLAKTMHGIITKEVTPFPDAPLSFNESIRFDGVCFSYGTSERAILSDISLELKKNEKYLILGKSGSGKSTLLKLIGKYYDSYEGKILLDGKSYAEYTEKQVATMVSLSQQNCYLFDRSLKRNIDFMEENNPEKMERVIDITALESFVALLPDGIETVINEEVNQVSGGEKLRINLARALYRNSEVLLLDEVTGALDKKTAERVERNLLSIKDNTLVNVCHKFNDSTLPEYDKIFIIEDGVIVREGSYKALEGDEKLLSYRNLA